MMALAFLLQAAPVAPTPPPDWATLPPLPLTQRLPESEALSTFVKGEIAAGRCPAPPRDAAGRWHLTVELALLVDKAGGVRRIVPRAIGCPTVEQYAVGVIASLARGTVAPPAAEAWFRFPAAFAWR